MNKRNDDLIRFDTFTTLRESGGIYISHTYRDYYYYYYLLINSSIVRKLLTFIS